MVENKSSLFGIIAIIIGAAGLGTGVFSIMKTQVVEGPQEIPSGVRRTWYHELNTTINININNSSWHSLGNWIPGGNLQFTVNEGEHVYLFFTASVSAVASSDYLLFRFYPHNTVLFGQLWVTCLSGATYSISLQQVVSNLLPGDYFVNVEVLSNAANDVSIYYPAILVHTFIP